MSQLWIICLLVVSITNVVKTNQEYLEYYDENEMDLTEEQLNALTGTSEHDLDLVRPNMSFKWDNGIIPYEFKSPQEFDGAFVNRILNVINFLNKNLDGCILIR